MVEVRDFPLVRLHFAKLGSFAELIEERPSLQKRNSTALVARIVSLLLSPVVMKSSILNLNHSFIIRIRKLGTSNRLGGGYSQLAR